MISIREKLTLIVFVSLLVIIVVLLVLLVSGNGIP